MEILRVKSQLEQSVIIKEWPFLVKDLPDGLKKMLTDKLEKLTEVKKIIPIFTDLGKITSILFELPTKIAILGEMNGLSEQSKTEIAETLELLLWHLSPRWTFSNPGAFGSPRHCTDCGMMARPAASECKNPKCPSHEKYRLVMGTTELSKAEKDDAVAIKEIKDFFKTAKKLQGLKNTA